MIKKLYKLALIVIVAAGVQTAAADVKVKSRQTMGGHAFENTTYIKGKRQRKEMMNGLTVEITQCDLRRSIQLNPSVRVYTVNPFSVAAETASAAPQKVSGAAVKGGTVTMTVKTKDTGERKQMFGYTARHLIITIETLPSVDACNRSGSKMVSDGWYIDFEDQFDCDNLSGGYQNGYTPKQGCQDKYTIKNIGTAKRGYPVYEKTTMFDGTGKEVASFINEVTEISKATLDPSLFEIPAGYSEAKNAASLYSIGAASIGDTTGSDGFGTAPSVKVPTAAAPVPQTLGPKKPGVVRIGMPAMRTGAVGAGMDAATLSAAFGNVLADHLKGPSIEVVAIDAKVDAAILAEARSKECDYVITGTVSHKKGGGGFGMFSKVIAPAVGATGIGHTGSVAGNIAGQVATHAIVSAGQAAANLKAKDEITFEVRMAKVGGSDVFAQTYKAKAKSDGDDVITQTVKQAAEGATALAK